MGHKRLLEYHWYFTRVLGCGVSRKRTLFPCPRRPVGTRGSIQDRLEARSIATFVGDTISGILSPVSTCHSFSPGEIGIFQPDSNENILGSISWLRQRRTSPVSNFGRPNVRMAASAASYAKMEESMTGEEIQDLVNKLPPITPGGMGRAVQAVAILLGIISVVVVSLRVYVRAGLSGASSRLWGPEDYLAVIGTVSLPSSHGKVVVSSFVRAV